MTATTTGMKEINFTPKRVLGVTDWRDRFFLKALAEVRAVASRTFDRGGVFATQVNISADGADKFKLSPFSDATDGEGRLFTPDAELAEGVKFENANGVDYSVGLHFAQRPRGFQANPRTSFPDIPAYEDTIGEQGVPNAVVDDGDGSMTITVDAVCESGVSHAGRTCVVWKTSPGNEATVETDAIEVLTVTWNGSNNKVSTVGNFGQGSSPSTTAADYAITLLGPTVRRHTDLSVVDGYSFIGVVTGAGAGVAPSVFDMSGQDVIDSTLSDFNEVTRIDSHGHMKLSVTADVSDSGEAQIEVKNALNVQKFSVDEAGNVVIKGDLTVEGDEFVQNTETINTNLVVGAQANLGDDDTDQHTVIGTWTHKFGGGSVAYVVDGVTGQATFNENMTVDAQLEVTGDVFLDAVLEALTLIVDDTSTFVGDALFDAMVTITRNSSTSAGPDPDIDDGLLMQEVNTSTNAIGPPIYWLHGTNTATRDGVVAYSKLMGASDVDLIIGYILDGAYDGAREFHFDMSAGDLQLQGLVCAADPSKTTAQANRLSKPNITKAWALIRITGTFTGVRSAPTIALLEGYGIKGPLVSDGFSVSGSSLNVKWATAFSGDDSYIALADLVEVSLTTELHLRPLNNILSGGGLGARLAASSDFILRDGTWTEVRFDEIANGDILEIYIHADGRQ